MLSDVDTCKRQCTSCTQCSTEVAASAVGHQCHQWCDWTSTWALSFALLLLIHDKLLYVNIDESQTFKNSPVFLARPVY